MVWADKEDCFIRSTKEVNNVCTYQGTDTVIIKRGLLHLRQADYYGQISITFQAINPPSNFFQGIELFFEAFLDDSWRYPIASVESGLAVSFECEHPCITCSANDPYDCESCANERDYLQEDIFTGRKTCVD